MGTVLFIWEDTVLCWAMVAARAYFSVNWRKTMKEVCSVANVGADMFWDMAGERHSWEDSFTFPYELWQTIHDFGIAHLGLIYMWAALMIGSGMILTGCMDSHYFDDIFEDE